MSHEQESRTITVRRNNARLSVKSSLLTTERTPIWISQKDVTLGTSKSNINECPFIAVEMERSELIAHPMLYEIWKVFNICSSRAAP